MTAGYAGVLLRLVMPAPGPHEFRDDGSKGRPVHLKHVCILDHSVSSVFCARAAVPRARSAVRADIHTHPPSPLAARCRRSCWLRTQRALPLRPLRGAALPASPRAVRAAASPPRRRSAQRTPPLRRRQPGLRRSRGPVCAPPWPRTWRWPSTPRPGWRCRRAMRPLLTCSRFPTCFGRSSAASSLAPPLALRMRTCSNPWACHS